MEVTDILEQVMDERSSKYVIDYHTLFIPFGSRNLSRSPRIVTSGLPRNRICPGGG